MSMIICSECDRHVDEDFYDVMFVGDRFICDNCIINSDKEFSMYEKENKWYAKGNLRKLACAYALGVLVVLGCWLLAGCTATVTVKYPRSWQNGGNDPETTQTITITPERKESNLERYNSYRQAQR